MSRLSLEMYNYHGFVLELRNKNYGTFFSHILSLPGQILTEVKLISFPGTVVPESANDEHHSLQQGKCQGNAKHFSALCCGICTNYTHRTL